VFSLVTKGICRLPVMGVLSLACCNVVPPLDCDLGVQRPGCHRDANGQYGYLYASPLTPPQQETASEIEAADDATCRSYGTIYGTPEYVQCRENLTNQRAANYRATVDAPAPLIVQQPPPVIQNPPMPMPGYVPPSRPTTTDCYNSLGGFHCTTQ